MQFSHVDRGASPTPLRTLLGGPKFNEFDKLEGSTNPVRNIYIASWTTLAIIFKLGYNQKGFEGKIFKSLPPVSQTPYLKGGGAPTPPCPQPSLPSLRAISLAGCPNLAKTAPRRSISSIFELGGQT